MTGNSPAERTTSGARGPASFWEWAAERPDHVAVIEPDGCRFTYGDVWRRSNRLARALRALRIGEGERVAGLFTNSRSFFDVALATQQVGVHLVPVNSHLTAGEISYVISDCGARLVFADETLVPLGTAALDPIGFPAGQRISMAAADGWVPLEEVLEKHSGDPPPQRIHGGVMLYTSGTTGRPKGVAFPVCPDVSPEDAVRATDALMRRRGMESDPQGVSLVAGPLYHGAPGAWGLAALHRGHSVVLLASWDSEEALRVIQRHRVTTVQMAPIHFQRLLQLPAEVRAGYDLTSLRAVCHAGAACPVETKRQMMAWWGPVLYEYYASSEGYGTSITPSEWLAHPGSVGQVHSDGADMHVTDHDGRTLPPGQVGTLWIRNPGGILSEYLNAPDKTRTSHRDGFYTVGDQAVIDGDGWVYIIDRRVDLILSGGVNVYPAEVEAALRQHPAVVDVGVIGLPDDEWGQRVHAVVVTTSGTAAGPELANELRDRASQSLAKFKLPRDIEFVPSLPYSPTGKLLRRRLVDERAGSISGRPAPQARRPASTMDEEPTIE